jgi:hypothetical protein
MNKLEELLAKKAAIALGGGQKKNRRSARSREANGERKNRSSV